MRDDFTGRLRAGSADFAGTVRPAAPQAVRARGHQRGRRQALAAAVLALALGAGGAGTAYASLGQPDRDGHGAQAAGRAPSVAASGTGQAGRPDIVAVTTKGALVVLDPLSGEARRILVARGVAGGAVAVAPDGGTVYFTARNGCLGEIESVPVAGGRARMIAPGARPALSPDGKKLAFARQPGSGAAGVCHNPPADDQVVVRDLAGGGETVLPSGNSPSENGTARPVPVTQLSWAPDGRRLLVAAGPAQAGQGSYLTEVDLATARRYLPSAGSGSVPVPGAAPGAYYRGGVFLPDGDLFVNRVCCTAGAPRVTSSLLLEVDPAGHLIRKVGTGFLDRVHTSFGADPSGHWLLYLSGPDLFLSLDGAAPFKLTTGLTAAAWA
jgi:WD40-like Beta Propeller Repeat